MPLTGGQRYSIDHQLTPYPLYGAKYQFIRMEAKTQLTFNAIQFQPPARWSVWRSPGVRLFGFSSSRWADQEAWREAARFLGYI
jgi:hypothetical protein